MSYMFNNEQKMNDIIFAHRNRAYGAYEIRSAYGSTVFRALSYMSLGFATMMSLAYYFTRPEKKPETPVPDYIVEKIYEIPVDLEKKPVQEKTRGGGPAPEKTNSGSSIGTTVRDSVETVSTSTSLAVNTSAVTSTLTGIPGGAGSSTLTTDDNSKGKGDDVLKIKVRSQLEVDEMPEFEGGLKALRDWLGRHTRYPEEAIEKGASGTVYVKFIVNEKGEVSGAELQNKVDEDLDREALRVVSAIPKFKSPGKVKGDAVSTYYQVPIRFMLK